MTKFYEPLRSHNFFDRRWVPPAGDRFCQLEPGDEKWASFFGLGHYVETKKKLYDVRDSEGDLIGYTRYDPTQNDGRRYLDIPLCTAAAVQRTDEAIIQNDTFQMVRVSVGKYNFDDYIFLCWFAALQDAEVLVRTRWIEYLGEDDRERYLYELRIRAAKSARGW